MSVLQKLEVTLDEMLDKKAPFKLSAGTRKGLAKALWWIALIVGILQLWAAWSLWQLGHLADRYIQLGGSLSVDVRHHAADDLGFFFYISLMVLAAEAILMIMAVSNLKALKKRQGWDFLYYALIINVAYGVVRALSDVGGGVGQLLWTLIGTTIGAYFLFQVRSIFMGGNPAHGKVGVEKTTHKTVK